MRRRTKSRPPICRMSWPQARTVRRAKHPKQGTRIALLSRRIPTRALAVGLVENLPTPTHILCRGESHLWLVLLVTNHSSELSSLWCSTKLAQKPKQVSYAVHFMALGAHSQLGAPIVVVGLDFCVVRETHTTAGRETGATFPQSGCRRLLSGPQASGRQGPTGRGFPGSWCRSSPWARRFAGSCALTGRLRG